MVRTARLLGALCLASCAPAPPVSAPPVSAPLVSAPLVSAPLVSAPPVSGARSGGCSKPIGAVGEQRLEFGGRVALYLVSLPKDYDAQRAYPLVFALHGRNRNHRNCQETDCAGIQSELSEKAVLVYPQSLREPLDAETSGWEHPEERDVNVTFFEALWAKVEADYCIERERVVLAGSSSGGTFAHLLGCRYGDRLRAIAAVAGGFPEPEACRGAPAAILIHGIDDPHVPIARGELSREAYVARSGCEPTTAPPLAEMHATIRQSRDASQEAAKCVEYVGCCKDSPVRWCEHSYGGYDGSTHGWPPVGGQLISTFVLAVADRYDEAMSQPD